MDKVITVADIRGWQPCYDPIKHLPENWTGTAVDILQMDNVPIFERLWAVLREEVIDLKTIRLFAVWCVRRCQHLLTDPRSITAIDVSERYANGLTTLDELDAACGDAVNAAIDVKNAHPRPRNHYTEAVRDLINAAKAASWVASNCESDLYECVLCAASATKLKSEEEAIQVKKLIEILRGGTNE